MWSLRARWNQFANAQAGTVDYFTLTSSHHSLTRTLLPIVERYASGRVLDLGAGFGVYRPVLERLGDAYVGVDVQFGNYTLDVLADGRHLSLAADAFDTVFCSQVLEHTPEPQRLLREAYRVLSPGGVLILSAPHLSYIHAAPDDYYRYTCYGLTFLLQRVGFEQIEVQPAGGIFSLLSSVPQSICLALLPRRLTGLIKWVLFVNRSLSRLFVAIDDVVNRGEWFTLNFVAVARK
jgi:SAM-dependent methyltransferase